MTNTNIKPLLIFIRGLPGSGKSYVTYALQDALKNEHVTVIDPDYIDTTNTDYKKFVSKLESEGLDPSIYPFRWLRQCTINAAKENALIIWNQPFTNRGVFDRLILYLKEQVKLIYGYDLQVLLIEVNTPPETAWVRVEQRVKDGGHGPDKQTFDLRCVEYESYGDAYPVLALDGESNIKDLVAQSLSCIESARRD